MDQLETSAPLHRYADRKISLLDADREDLGAVSENQIRNTLAGNFTVEIQPQNGNQSRISVWGQTPSDGIQRLVTETHSRTFYRDEHRCRTLSGKVAKRARPDEIVVKHTLLEYLDELYARSGRRGLGLFDPNVWEVLSVTEDVVHRDAGDDPLPYEESGYNRQNRTLTMTFKTDAGTGVLTLSKKDIQPSKQNIHSFKTRFFRKFNWTPALTERQWRELVEEWYVNAVSTADSEGDK